MEIMLSEKRKKIPKECLWHNSVCVLLMKKHNYRNIKKYTLVVVRVLGLEGKDGVYQHQFLGFALISVAQLVGHHPTKQEVASSISGQGSCLSCGFHPWLVHMEPIKVSLLY